MRRRTSRLWVALFELCQGRGWVRLATLFSGLGMWSQGLPVPDFFVRPGR